jgi:hypothetical protein
MPDPSFFLPLFVESAILPFGVSLAVLLMLRKSRLHALAPLFAVAFGFLASYVAVFHNQWTFPPRQALDWLPAIILLGGIGAALAEASKRIGFRLTLRLLISFATVTIVAWPILFSDASENGAMLVAAAGMLIFAAWSYLARAAKSRPTPPLLLTVVSGGAGLALMLDASQLLGQLTGALAAALAACAVFSISRLRLAFSGAATGFSVLLLGALLTNAYIYADVSLLFLALLSAGLLADAVIEVVNHRRRHKGGTGSWMTAAALSAVPVLMTIGLAIKAAQDSGGY